MIDLAPLGDRAFLARFETEADASAWANALRLRDIGLLGIVDVVTAYRSVGIYADPERADFETLDATLRSIAPCQDDLGNDTRLIALPVLYDGPDLAEVAGRLGLSVHEVIAAHCGVDYQVFALGFVPGFPYAGYLPATLSGLPRRAEPRTRVPAGSVAIAGMQTGVYPRESPGGWQILGRTPLTIAEPQFGHFPIQAGDRLRFEPVDFTEYTRRLGECLGGPDAGSTAPASL
jgi:KipI family sensor histidine kinase inhibitor